MALKYNDSGHGMSLQAQASTLGYIAPSGPKPGGFAGLQPAELARPG